MFIECLPGPGDAAGNDRDMTCSTDVYIPGTVAS